MSPGIRVRHISDGDWDSIAALEADAYESRGLSEEPAALKSRARASPATCFVLEIGQRIAGYALSLPYPAFRYPDLTRAEELSARSFRSQNLHLHDLVIGGGFRRRGLGNRLHQHLTATARSSGYQRISLVAVAGSDTFWSANGYQAHAGLALPDCYGANAVYMSKAIQLGEA
jgi:ribosomal protein S18 acetylase RimI-like enzyme